MSTSTLSSPSTALSLTGTLNSGAPPATASSSVGHYAGLKPNVGTAAGQANQLYSNALTVATGTPLVLDVTNLIDPLGNPINMAHVLAILVSNQSKNAGEDLTVGGGTNPVLASETDPVQANGGAIFLLAPNPGYAVDSTHKNLQISAAAGAAVGVQVSILGRST